VILTRSELFGLEFKMFLPLYIADIVNNIVENSSKLKIVRNSYIHKVNWSRSFTTIRCSENYSDFGNLALVIIHGC